MSNPILQLKKLTKTFSKGKVKALNEISFSLSKGKILALVGESGSGKTTLIRIITGLETQNNGSVVFKNNILSSNTIFIEPEKRNIGMVFQEYALFPHFTVFDNIAFGISKNKKERITEVLDLVALEGFEKRFPHELSGGQQQRVALARALAPKPELLILDEPFSNLDVILRQQLRSDIKEILKKTNTTAIFVTHDIKDALKISDEILVLQKGNLLQHGNTDEVFKNPNCEYVSLLFDAYKI
ncbi:MAG: ABC transporter ATP-binding protein [Polaribacter sp.]|nr:ABC transporter ATP-binding protein [Polaribacter sp.]